MSTITFDCPDSVLRSLHESREGFGRHLRVLAAVKLYELGKLSSGRAAELAGMTRINFFQELASHGVGLYDAKKDELSSDMKVAEAASHDSQ